ncbi:MAG: hypothetical protein KDK78_01855 [Chlamydiia bacterium]|nr:hypothetical protein [Chlamydiia bacterium]
MQLTRLLTAFICCCACSQSTLSANQDAVAQVLEMAQKPGECFFDAPSHWWVVDPKILPKNVKILVKAPEANKYPPCANLAVDKVNCDLKTYLKRIKALNDAEGLAWRDLGSIQTKAGTASLSQVDTETNWGPVRMMHAIFIRDVQAHILTCAALKSEFPRYYDTFFEMMQSMRVNEGLFDSISDRSRRETLQRSFADLKNAYQALRSEQSKGMKFEDETFQQEYWKKFSELLHRDFGDMSTAWQDGILKQCRDEIAAID